jgi:hypothetical protein
MDEQIVVAVRERAREGMLRCVEAFRVAEELGVTPMAVGEAADALSVRLTCCQLGLFGYGERKSIVEPAEAVTPGVEWAIRDGLILGRLPCAVAWAIATRFGMPKLQVANAAEKLGVRVGQCQLGAF